MKRLGMVVVILFLTSALAYASGGGEGGAHDSHKIIDFGWRLFSFAVLAGLLYKLTRQA